LKYKDIALKRQAAYVARVKESISRPVMSSTARSERPLSPHLQVYRPQLTSTMSIFHRFTGIWLSLGLPLVVAWLQALADPSAQNYDYFVAHLRPGLGKVAVFIGLSLLILFVLYKIEMVILSSVKSGRGLVNTILFVLDLLIGMGASWQLFMFADANFADDFTMYSSWLGVVMLFGWTWAFLYHTCTGIRHLLWDAGWFLDIRSVYITGWTAFGVSTLATAYVWSLLMGWV
jgi:succinate dehydrogenase / fumarate reductase cytochrome b subunit